MKFYSTIKKDDIIKFAYKLIELKNVISSETIKTQEANSLCSTSSKYLDMRILPGETTETEKYKETVD